MRVNVVGLKRFVGVVDGQSISSGKLFAEVLLDDSRNGKDQFSKGRAVEELRVTPEIVKSLEGLPLPFMAECETQRVSNGKTSREQVTAVRPINTSTGEIAPPIKQLPKAA